MIASCSRSAPKTGQLAVYPDAPLLRTDSRDGHYHVEVRSAPSQPPKVGNHLLQYIVTDKHTGAPMERARIDVIPWMTEHRHGTTPVTVIPQGKGVYTARDVVFSMPGEWEVRTRIHTKQYVDDVNFTVTVGE